MDLDEFLDSTHETVRARQAIRDWLEAAIERVVTLATEEGWAEVTVGQRDADGVLTKVGVNDGKLYLQRGDSTAQIIYNPEEDSDG